MVWYLLIGQTGWPVLSGLWMPVFIYDRQGEREGVVVGAVKAKPPVTAVCPEDCYDAAAVSRQLG
jgi:hypothetical protein